MRRLDSLCLTLELIARLRELSDEPREVSGLFHDVAGDGRLDEAGSADFVAALRELHAVSGTLLEAAAEKSPGA